MDCHLTKEVNIQLSFIMCIDIQYTTMVMQSAYMYVRVNNLQTSASIRTLALDPASIWV